MSRVNPTRPKTRKKTKRKAPAARKVYPVRVYSPIVRPTRVAEPSESYTFSLEKAPVPKGRPRMTRYGKTYTPERTLQAESDVREAYQGPFFEGCIKLEVTVTPTQVLVTVSHSDTEDKSKLRGDLDNYVKLISDALNGVAFEDDKQVHEIHARKQ